MLAAPIGWGAYSGAVVTGAESDTAGLTPVSAPRRAGRSPWCSAGRKLWMPAEFRAQCAVLGDGVRKDRMMAVIGQEMAIP
jgi:hypothetical protein